MCDSSPCYNGGTCHYESGVAKCECLPGYDGRFCELSKYIDWQCSIIRNISLLRKVKILLLMYDLFLGYLEQATAIRINKATVTMEENAQLTRTQETPFVIVLRGFHLQNVTGSRI